MPRLESRIGLKAKELRNKNNLTLKELSEKTDLSVGYLSQFERGINTIAIDSLNKIASVYGVNLNYFFSEDERKQKKSSSSIVIKSYKQKVLDVIGNNYIVKHLASENKGHTMYPRLIEILPQMTDEDIKPYAHLGEEFIYVLEGVLTLIHEDKIYNLFPGDSAYYSSESMHNWANDTNKNVKILCISTPNPLFDENIVIDEDHV